MQVAMKSPNLNEFSSDSQRKTISLVSPVVKSRGARFLDLVKNNKLNVSPQLNKKLSMHGKNLMERSGDTKKDDLFKFSDVQPNLNSSPSSSILSKRKAAIETPDSPSQNNSAKRKRVSFNDPVSTTKEYLITEEEERLKSNSLIRCLTYENDENAEQEEDEMCENKENIMDAATDEKVIQQHVEKEVTIQIKKEQEEIETNSSIVMDHDYQSSAQDNSTQDKDITTSSVEDTSNSTEQATACHKSESQFVFKDNEELMDYVRNNLGNVLDKVDVNDVLNELLPIQDSKQTKMTSEQLERTSIFINHLSKMMKTNDRTKHKVLDTLAEKHSKDFLSVALQENSVSTVCQKLTVPSIVNYLIHKVNVCDEEDEIDLEVNRLNRTIMHHLIKKTSRSQMISDQKEIQELLKVLFQNTPKIEVLDTVHEFLRSNIIQGPF